jgi:hypothetical protein
MSTYQKLNGSRFIMHHAGGIDVYFDSRHKIIKCLMTDGSICELIKERQQDGSYRDQMLSINNHGVRTVIEKINGMKELRRDGDLFNARRWLVLQDKKTIKALVELVDELRQPFNNSPRHDLYLKATGILNQMEDEGRI